MKTITVQIGNSDDKLTQREWSAFCQKLFMWCDSFGNIHFAGGSPTEKFWQNYAVVFNMRDESDEPYLKDQISRLGQRFNQDSIAWTEGETEFI